MFKHIALMLLLVISPITKAYATTDNWVEVRSEHFTVLTNSSGKDARHIAGQFERMRALFHQLLPHSSSDDGITITVVALRDKKSFQLLEPSAYLAKNQLDLAGLFMESPQGNFVLMRLDTSDEDHPYTTIYHEYTHFMLRSGSNWIPLWLNEGLAEFYQNTDIFNSAVSLGQPSPDDILYLREHTLIPLTTLFRVDNNSPYYHNEQKGSIFYSESWALTHYLEMNDFKNKTTHLQDYANYLQHHEDPVAAAQHAFGNLDALEVELRNYVSRSNFLLFHMNSGISLNESALQIIPVMQTDADAVRAEVLINTDRRSEAQALLDSVLKSNPNNITAHEAMGYLMIRNGDNARAKEWYGDAVQLGSQNYLAHYYFAVMSIQTNDESNPDAIESSLRAAIKLNPNFAPSYDALAGFYASRHEKLDEAHMLNVSAVSLDPENVRYRMNAAEVLVVQQRFTDALSVLKAALRLPLSGQETSMVNDRISQIQRFQNAAQLTHTSDSAYNNAQSKSSRIATQTTVVSAGNGDTAADTEQQNDPSRVFPAEATGAHHSVRGTISNIVCSYPTVLTFDFQPVTKSINGKAITSHKLSLYSNNYFKIDFSAANFTPAADLSPCKDIQGMSATVEYAEIHTTPADNAAEKSAHNVDGKVLSIVLRK